MYRIETVDQYGIWTDAPVTNDPSANQFGTEGDAWDAIGQLRSISREWFDADYRVVTGDD